MSRIGTLALVTALDLLLWRKLPGDVRARLQGKRVEIAVTDWKGSYHFEARPWGFAPRAPVREPDLRIAARARDFGAIAAGEADADTLYFGQRLIVEGDTELALMVKNTLDALDVGTGRRLARRAHHLMGRLRAARGPHSDAQA